MSLTENVFSGCCTFGFELFGKIDPPVTECSRCPAPDGMSRCWEFTVAGITIGGGVPCPDCVNLNGTHIVEWDSLCVFKGDPFPFGCLGFTNAEWVLMPVTPPFQTTKWRLQPTGISGGGSSEFAVWQIEASVFDCNGPNVLTFSSMTGACANAPSTITITPVVCP